MINKIAGIISIAAIGLFLFASPTAASGRCESLTSLELRDGKITSASLVEAGKFTPPMGGGPMMGGVEVYKNAPAFCRVTATLAPTSDSDIKVEVWMPSENWNGKLVGVGNGVWAGNISYSAMAVPLSRGYATAATDTGHVGSGMDAKFAVGHKEKLVDFGHRAIHEMTTNAKSIIKEYYGKEERMSLWVSCSTGGRQGLMEAYRYPEDYDGISAMAPANPMVGLMIGSLWTGYAVMKDDVHKLPMPKIMASNKAYIGQCDITDGLKDGIVSDPEICSYHPGIIQCSEKDQQDNCLTAPQVEALRDIYDGVKNPRTGEQVFSGFPPGSEQQLMALTSGTEPFPVATSYFRDIVFENPKWDFRSFDYDKDVIASYEAGSDILDVPSDGFSRFFQGGGKLLLSHGWADGLIPAPNTVEFYKAMIADMDPEKAKDSVRLFMVPGMGHCGGGNAPCVLDMLSVIDKWVSEGKAPKSIIASNPPNLNPMTRPICPYPQVAVYKGPGSTDDAANFACRSK